MKLEINRNFPFIHTERVLSPTAEAGQNLWGGAPHFKPKNISQYFDLFFDNETVQRAITDLSETGLGQGYFTSVVDPKYDKAKQKCDAISSIRPGPSRNRQGEGEKLQNL